MRRTVRYILFAAALLAAAVCFSSQQPAIAAGGKTVRVGWYLVDGLHNIDKDGQASGYDYEYLKAIAQYTGWKYEFVPGTWDECLSRLEKGEIDILGCVDYSKERVGKIDYSEDYAGMGGSRLVCRKSDRRFAYNDYAALRGKKIGVAAKSVHAVSFAARCRLHGVPVNIVDFNDQHKILSDLDKGKIDLVIITQSRRINNYRSVIDFDPRPFYFATSKKRPELHTELNEAIAQIKAWDSNYDASLREKYFIGASGIAPNFTKEEQRYIDSHRIITVAYDPAWPPLEYKDKDTGKMAGVMSHVFREISKTTGIKFRFITSDSFAKTIKESQTHAQIFSLLSFDYHWGDMRGYLLTQPIFNNQVVRVYAKDAPMRIVALPEGYYITYAIRARYAKAGLKVLLYPTVKDCLEAVYAGRADATFLYSMERNYYSSIPRYSKLKYQVILGFSQRLSVAVSAKENRLLFSIIHKAVSSISEQDLSRFVSMSSTAVRSNSIFDLIYTNPWQVFTLLALLLLLLFMTLYFIESNIMTRRKSAELAALNKRLTEANTAKSDFLSRMSHDIRTPMNGIIGMVRIAREHNLSPQTADALDKIDISAEYLLGLINDVLDMSKIESGEFKLDPEPYKPDDFFRYIDSVIRPLCEIKHQELCITGSPSREYMPMLDKLRINQIIFNSLSNSIKYTQEGGRLEYHLEENIMDDGRMEMIVSVSDNGHGMSEDFQKHLFEPYVQEDRVRSMTKQGGGTGLGLAIVKRIIDLMGGTITVKSKINEGTTFTMRVLVDCVKISDLDNSHENLNIDKEKLAGKKVLVCEDNKINQEIIKSVLEQVGMVVSQADDGLSGMQMFERSPVGYYDCILMDIRMPIMDGYEVTRAIRGMDRADAKTVPVMAMTADAFEDDVRKCFEAGMNSHVAKPIEPDLLFSELVRLIK
jgi:two-component system sensor histidine kinase EvgS